eukprot:CAMPEP_0181433206 /NCGR_PEP_ID=MMETSP1110-20121109/19169_1 /TAXON_ID=174948 /ORGANISM="Symbiodinium sp., Strain CCMP421" /LENGTH=527 /DNA_ID=CAMNT_0023556645 /DNA_START=119 /DNA_END=1702 /DNA_ORIENTATION=+
MDEDVMRIMETNFRQVTLEDANAKAELATTDAKIAGLNSLYSQDPYAVEATDAVEAVSSGEFPDAAEIQDMKAQLCKLEEDVRSFVMRYRKVGHGRSLSYPTRRFFDEKMQGISDEMHRLHRGASTVSSSENTVMQTAFLGIRKRRFKSLRDVVRKVTTEIRIARLLDRWTDNGATPRSRGIQQSASTDFEGLISKMQIDVWDGVDVLDLDKRCGEPMYQVFMAIWHSHNLSGLVKAKKNKVQDYIRAVEAGYHKTNAYHNNAHAAEVTLMTYQIWSYLSAGSFKGYFEQVDLLVVLLAAAIHDIAHPGTNNDFLVKTKTDLALRYHDTAVLENFHLATAFELMRARQVSMLEHNLPSPPVTSLRRRIVEIVLATDMAIHKKQVDDMARVVERCPNRQEIDKRQLEQYLVHTADVGHPFRPVPQHQEWARRVNEEFLAQGDREKELGFTPIEMFDREKAPPLPKNQMGFLQFVIQPLWKPMEALLDAKSKPACLFLQRNIRAWQDEISAAREVEKSEEPSNSEPSTA